MADTQAATPTFIAQFWPHITAAIGALIAVGLGAADHFAAVNGWGVGVDLSLIWGGLGTLGVTAVAAYKA